MENDFFNNLDDYMNGDEIGTTSCKATMGEFINNMLTAVMASKIDKKEVEANETY